MPRSPLADQAASDAAGTELNQPVGYLVLGQIPGFPSLAQQTIRNRLISRHDHGMFFLPTPRPDLAS